MKNYKFAFIALLALVFAGCGVTPQTASPTEVFKSQFEAQKKKDTTTMKANLSKASLEMMEKLAQSQNKTVDELLAQDSALTASQPDKIETRNEKISGDSATLEVKSPEQDEWLAVPFVKEDGKWKIALDVFMQNLQQMIDQMKKSAPDGAGNTSTNAPTSR